MGMDVLHCQTVAGVPKELAIYVLVYNLVRLVMVNAATQQGVPAERSRKRMKIIENVA
jgi:hypothetical protein